MSDDVTIQQQFEDFHRTNPHVYEILQRLATEWIDQTGGHKCGIGMLWERMRWELRFHADDPGSEFKLNNNYRSRYVRLLIEHHPDWSDYFELRQLRAS